MKHNQQTLDAFVRIRATGASHTQIAQNLGISKNTSCKWAKEHAEAIQETIRKNLKDADFYENVQRDEELVQVDNIIEKFLHRIESEVHPQTEAPTGTTGMPIPVPQIEPTQKNPNKTNGSSENQCQNIPQKNHDPIPVAEHPAYLPKGPGVLRSSAAFPSNSKETPPTTEAASHNFRTKEIERTNTEQELRCQGPAGVSHLQCGVSKWCKVDQMVCLEVTTIND